jgi:replicative DNA helicase
MSDYNDADYIEMTIRCLYREKKVLQKALDLAVKPEDFGGINIYRLFAEAALNIAESPINPKLCLAEIKTLFKKYDILEADFETVLKFHDFIYSEQPVNADYLLKNLADFVRFRRYQAIKADKIGSPEDLVKEASRLVADIETRDNTAEVKVFNPFRELVVLQHKETIPTGFNAIDSEARGLNLQELGLIIGHSGSGKTAMAVYSAIQSAKRNRKVLYLSLEEPAENICSRVYSNVFRIPYTDLHKGSALKQQDLRESFSQMSEIEKAGLQNLQVHDLRYVTPITCRYIQNYLDQLYETTGYHPDVIYIDQLDYITSIEKCDQQWQKYERAAFEVDKLCDHLIGGQHKFSVFLLHQAAGKMTKRYTNAEISGFKGVIKPADMVLAIGRDSTLDNNVNIFSLKCRHSKNFQYEYLAELEYMNFEQVDSAEKDRIKKEEQSRQNITPSAYKNIPQKKTPMLPSTSSGFLGN